MDFLSFGCCLTAFVLYYNTLDAGFVYDDRRAILTNPDVLPTTPWTSLLQNDFWGTPLADSGSHGSYRPLCVFSFRLNHLLGGFQPWGYHLVNVLLHCLATGLVVRVARKIFPLPYMPVGPAVAGLLFATHPIHTEAVAGIVGRADLAACNFYLLSFLAYAAHLKYREQRCLSSVPEQAAECACCDAYPTRPEKKNLGKKKHANSRPKHHQLQLQQKKTDAGPEAVVDVLTKVYGAEDLGLCECGSAANGSRVGCKRRMCKQWMAMSACVMMALAAVLCKETGITVLIVCALYDITNSSFVGFNKRQVRSLVILGLALLSMLIFRLYMTWGNTPQFASADNPTAKASSIVTRFLTFSYLPTFNFKLLVCPVTLSFDWSMEAIPRITSILDTRNLISLIFYASLFQAVKSSIKKLYQKEISDRKSRRMIKTIRKRCNEQLSNTKNHNCACPVCNHSLADHHSFMCRASNNNNNLKNNSSCICQPLNSMPNFMSRHLDVSIRVRASSTHVTLLTALAFLTMPFLPATNIFFYVGFVVAERVLYLPSVGYCLLLGLGAATIRKSKIHIPACGIALAVLLAFFGMRTIHRNWDWFNEEKLYASAVTINPAKAYGNLGTILSNQGRINEAELAFKMALGHRSNMADIHYNLGNILTGKQKYDEAIESYQRAINFRPSLALAYLNMGSALISAGRTDEAAIVLRHGSRLDGTGVKDRNTHDTARVSSLLQLASLYTDQGNLQRALVIYKEAVQTMPSSYPPQSVYNLLGETLTRLHKFEEAERWYQAALQAQPDHVPAHITYGKLLAKNGSRIAEAEQWFRRAQRLAPSDPSVYHHYGEFLASQGRHQEAAEHYVRASELKPEDYELAVAAATALRQADRRADAERWYRHAVIMRPLDPRGHTNLGAMLHLNGKYLQAADSYREALRLEPDDLTTLTNLHKLNSVMA